MQIQERSYTFTETWLRLAAMNLVMLTFGLLYTWLQAYVVIAALGIVQGKSFCGVYSFFLVVLSSSFPHYIPISSWILSVSTCFHFHMELRMR